MSPRVEGLRRAALAFAACALAGCGFTPLYAGNDGAAVQQQMNTVAVGIIPDRTGQMLREALQTQLDGGSAPTQELYVLSVSYSIATEGIGVQQDTSTSRNRFIATASWRLAPIGDPARPLAQGEASTEDAANIVDEQYFALTLETDTINRQLAGEIAAQISTQVAAYFKTHPGNV